MNPHFRSRGGPSNLKGFTHYTKQKVPNELSTSRIDQDVNYNDTTNYNPLFFAVHNGKLKLTHSLLKEFSLHVRISGKKIIHIAAARGHEQIICLLRQRGAEISQGDIDGNTPLHLAVKENHIDVVNLLLTDDFIVNLQNLKGATPLHIATQMKNFLFVKILLENGAKVDLQDVYGKTPLHISTGKINPNLEIVSILLTHGASVHASCKKGFTPLHCVTNSGNVKILEVLIDHGASLSVKNENKMDPLCLAIQKNKTEMIKYILEKRTDVDFINIGNMMPLHFAAQTGNEEIVKMLVTKGDADMINASGEELKTPLHFSAANGHINVLKYLIESGALIDVEAEGFNTPLHISAAAGHSEIVSELLNRGAKIDSLNNEKCTPLYLALRAKHKEVVSLLINKGACLDCQIITLSDVDVLPAFHIAAKSGDLEILKIFLKSGIEVDLKSKNEKTALHFSATFGHTKLVEELIKAGAEINSRTKFLETPLHLAAASGRSETVKYLLNSGADVAVTTDKDYTPLHYALDRERHDGLRNPHNSSIRFPVSSSTRISTRRLGSEDDIPSKQVVISPFYFEQYLKITEMLLIKGASTESENLNQKSPLHYAFKIKVSNENQLENASNSLEEVNALERRPENPGQGEFRPEIVRCLLNYGAKIESESIYSRILGDDTLLDEVIKSKCPAMVDVLLEYDIKKTLNYESALELFRCQVDYNIMLAIAEQISDVDTIAKLFLRQTRYNPFQYRLPEKKFVKSMLAILVKMRSTSKTDYAVESEQLEILEKNKLLPWYTQCELEVINMQKMKIHHQFELTFYEILTKPVSELANYVRNKDLMRILDSGVCKKFQVYAPLLERNIERGKERKALIDSCNECFFSLIRQNCEIQLPNLVVNKIFEYLSVIDLRRLSATITKKSYHYKRPSYAHRFRYDKRK